MNTTRLMLLLALALILITTALARPGPPVAQEPRAHDRPQLAAFLRNNPGRGPGPGGITTAVWDDGLVIYASRPAEPGQDLHVGRIPPEQVQVMLDELHEAGFFDDHQRMWGMMPDAAYSIMGGTRDDATITYRWLDSYSAVWGVNADAEQEFRDFVRMWAISRAAIAFAQPAFHDSVPLKEDREARERLRRVRRQLGP